MQVINKSPDSYTVLKRFFFIISLFLAAPAATAQVDTSVIDRRANSFMTQYEMTGLAVAVVENGETTFAKGYGETLPVSYTHLTLPTKRIV